MLKKREEEKLKKLAQMSDLDFYDEFLADAPFEEQAEFFREFPEFLEEDAAGEDDFGGEGMDSSEILKMAADRLKRESPDD